MVKNTLSNYSVCKCFFLPCLSFLQSSSQLSSSPSPSRLVKILSCG
uniref:BTB domain-containing protein n=1 Tax=Parascaris univalens TaxID=6257 RepID=A0A915A726_PARUN